VEFLTSSYQSDFSLSGLNFESTLLILAVGVLLGWIGARVSVKRHISEIEPN
jgi:cell division transport system permease protein